MGTSKGYFLKEATSTHSRGLRRDGRWRFGCPVTHGCGGFEIDSRRLGGGVEGAAGVLGRKWVSGCPWGRAL